MTGREGTFQDQSDVCVCLGGEAASPEGEFAGGCGFTSCSEALGGLTALACCVPLEWSAVVRTVLD